MSHGPGFLGFEGVPASRRRSCGRRGYVRRTAHAGGLSRLRTPPPVRTPPHGCLRVQRGGIRRCESRNSETPCDHIKLRDRPHCNTTDTFCLRVSAEYCSISGGGVWGARRGTATAAALLPLRQLHAPMGNQRSAPSRPGSSCRCNSLRTDALGCDCACAATRHDGRVVSGPPRSDSAAALRWPGKDLGG